MISEKIKVLYVDDEEQNLRSFHANFRKEYDVQTALSAAEALGLLEKNIAHIIISDQRMPNTTGVEFLEQTNKLYPDSVRLLITGQADIDVVIAAINQGQISKYIQKPWDWEKLAIAIDNCATLYKSRIELKLKNEELQKTNNELNKFVYSASHDLRSPLTSILGVINLTKLKPELRVADPYFAMIEGRILKLDNFIKKIIEYYKNDRVEEIKDIIDFKSLISTIWDTIKNQDLTINFELNIQQEGIFFGDVFRLGIVFENLISNAIKYQNPANENHYIKINITSNQQEMRCTISDSGIGIGEEYIDNIFKLFYRAEDSLNKDGTGIGLYIVKEAIDKMKGKISVTSTPLIGSTFEIIIPNKLME